MVITVSDINIPCQKSIFSYYYFMITGKETVDIRPKTFANAKMSTNPNTITSSKLGFSFKSDICSFSYFQVPPPVPGTPSVPVNPMATHPNEGFPRDTLP